MSQPKKDKSRNLTTYQFFQILQLEWIVADLRVRIYPKKSDKDHYTKVKEGKRQTIASIAEKNVLPTIFSDEEMKRDYSEKVYNTQSHPNFFYKDEHDRNAKEPLDLLYYYAKGKEVRFELNGEVKVGIVKNYIPSSTQISIEYQDSVLSLPIVGVMRIL